MSYLLDTHILLWWLFDEAKLNTTCRDIIYNFDNRILVSSASAWEISTKHRIGKLPEAKELIENYAKILQDSQFVELAVTADHAIRAVSLPIDRRDPLDRMLMAQAEIEDLPILTYDPAFKTGLIQTIPS